MIKGELKDAKRPSTNFGTNGKPACDLVNIIVTFIISRAFSKISQSIGHMVAVDMNASFLYDRSSNP